MTFKQSTSDRKLNYSSLHLRKTLDVCGLFLMARMRYAGTLSTKLPYTHTHTHIYIYFCLGFLRILYFHISALQVSDAEVINLKLLHSVVFQ